MSARAFLSLGSNLGDRKATLMAALDALDRGGARIVRRSSFHETAPVGKTDQPRFLNLVAEVATDLAPADLLALCQSAERDLGRVRAERWGPRTVDIDILLYDRLAMQTPSLTIPHPEMTRRRFVLVSLLEIAPDATLTDGRRLDAFLGDVADQDVRRVEA